MLLGAATGTYSALAYSLLPWATHFGLPFDVMLPTSTLVVAYAIFHLFLWNASGQMTDTATELNAAMALSREVAQSLDPQLVGRSIARHIAVAAGASALRLRTCHRAADTVLTPA